MDLPYDWNDRQKPTQQPEQSKSAVECLVMLPCPFCGEIPLNIKDGDSTYLRCDNPDCYMKVYTFSYPNKKDAIEAWNKRAI